MVGVNAFVALAVLIAALHLPTTQGRFNARLFGDLVRLEDELNELADYESQNDEGSGSEGSGGEGSGGEGSGTPPTTETPEVTTQAPEPTTEAPEPTTEAPGPALCGHHDDGEPLDVYEDPSCCSSFKCWGDSTGSCPDGTFYFGGECVDDIGVCGQRPVSCEAEPDTTPGAPVTTIPPPTPPAGPLCGSRRNGQPKSVFENPSCCSKFRCWGNKHGSCPEGLFYKNEECVPDSSVCGSRPIACTDPLCGSRWNGQPWPVYEAPFCCSKFKCRGRKVGSCPAGKFYSNRRCVDDSSVCGSRPTFCPTRPPPPLCAPDCSSIKDFNIERQEHGQLVFSVKTTKVCKNVKVVFDSSPTDMHTPQGNGNLNGTEYSVNVHRYVLRNRRGVKTLQFNGHYDHNAGVPNVLKILLGDSDCPVPSKDQGKEEEVENAFDEMFDEVEEVEEEVDDITYEVEN